MMTTARDHLSKADAITVARTEAAIPGLAAARLLIDRFVRMTRNYDAAALPAWLPQPEP